MPFSRPPVLITTSITPVAERTILANVESRLKATCDALYIWFSKHSEYDYVVCDGSGFDLTGMVEAIQMRLARRVQVEVLVFKNDFEKVARQGKGYGEGQIINYALDNSRILGAAEQFSKCTGKLWVENFSLCMLFYNGAMGFELRRNKPNFIVDTRFFTCRIDLFREALGSAFTRVNEEEGLFIEHCYADALSVIPKKRWIMLPAPAIRGISGSMGSTYKSSNVRIIVKSVHSLFIRAGLIE